VNILEATADAHLFARWFKDRETWQGWFAFLSALFALPMSPEHLVIFQDCTGRDQPPKEQITEAWLVCGRRAGKSFILALTAVFLATFYNWKPFLSPGENGFIMIIAADRRQAKVIFKYIRALLTEVPMLARMIKLENAESIELTNGVVIDIATCNYKTVRGRTILAALCDELCFWQGDDSVNPDREVLDALRPGMSTIPGAMLLCASSPYARRGAMWEAYNRFYGKSDAPALVWKAATRTMNSTVPQRIIDEAMERDPASASAEFLAEFRQDCEALVTREAVMACVKPGMFERKPERRYRYTCFVDVSGGVSDSSVIAISHREADTVILDAVIERKAPHSPEVVCEEFAAFAKTYRCLRVTGDAYGGEFPREQFRRHGLNYDVSEKSRSQLYTSFLPMLNSGSVDLLDNERMVNQFVGLERRTSRSGRDSIDHGPSGKDDVANAVAGACCNVRKTDNSNRGPIAHESVAGYSIHDGKWHNPNQGNKLQ
jgi:Phage Terminase